MTYECHITIAVKHADVGEKVATAFGWKTSEIKRDPLLGDDSHFYLTAHEHARDKMRAAMLEVEKTLQNMQVPILRSKIEHIIYDTKTGVDVYAS